MSDQQASARLVLALLAAAAIIALVDVFVIPPASWYGLVVVALLVGSALGAAFMFNPDEPRCTCGAPQGHPAAHARNCPARRFEYERLRRLPR